MNVAITCGCMAWHGEQSFTPSVGLYACRSLPTLIALLSNIHKLSHIKILVTHFVPTPWFCDFVTWIKFPSQNRSILHKIDADSRPEKCPHACLRWDYTGFQHISVFSCSSCALYIFVDWRTHSKNICPLSIMGQRIDMMTTPGSKLFSLHGNRSILPWCSC